MKKKIPGYRSIKEELEIIENIRNRKVLLLENNSNLEFSKNFEIILGGCKNKKTPSILFKKHLLTIYKKQEQVFEELNILDTDEDTIVECVLQLASLGKIKNHLIIGCCREYMIEIRPIRDKKNKKFYVLCRKFAEWPFDLEKKKYLLSLV